MGQYEDGYKKGLKAALQTIRKMLQGGAWYEEDDEAVQQVVVSSDTNTQEMKDNEESDDDKDESTTDTQAIAKKTTKKDVDNMTDEQILVQGLKRDQDTFEPGVQQEVINRATKILQKNQTGTMTDRDRNNIINAIIAMQNEEGKF